MEPYNTDMAFTAFIFSLKKQLRLPLFISFARAKYDTIFNHSYHGLLFEVTNPGLQITDRDYGTIREATGWIENPNCVPTEVNDE